MPETLAPPLSPALHAFSSAAYWEQRYRSGGQFAQPGAANA